ncbi:MAG: hypothetical protein LUF92_16715, partial [Clostridiales bacterium]|nr:hypothetical protein [Clostridiales bacterium]
MKIPHCGCLPGLCLCEPGHRQHSSCRHALSEIERTFADVSKEADAPRERKAMAAFAAAMATVLLHLPLKSDRAFAEEKLMLLPSGLRFFACYVQAHQA